MPLWGEVTEPAAGTSPAEGDEEGGGGAEGDGKRRKASRRDSDQTQRDDPLMLNRFEKILGLAEMVNLNRKTEDDDEESARKAAEDLDEIALGQHERKASTRLKLDLDWARRGRCRADQGRGDLSGVGLEAPPLSSRPLSRDR